MSDLAQQALDDLMLIQFAGETFEPLLSGALYWAETQTLLVADLHLEKMASFAPKGQLLPPYDSGLTLKALARDIAETRPQRVICLGDSFHRDEGTLSLPEPDRALLAMLTDEVEWIWLAGNHDPKSHQLGGTCIDTLAIGPVTLRHEPVGGLTGQIAGHLHPAARVMMGGRSVRRACFAHDGNLLILPAYGVSTGNLNILSRAFSGLWDRSALSVTMLGRDRIYPVSPKRLVDG